MRGRHDLLAVAPEQDRSSRRTPCVASLQLQKTPSEPSSERPKAAMSNIDSACIRCLAQYNKGMRHAKGHVCVCVCVTTLKLYECPWCDGKEK